MASSTLLAKAGVGSIIGAVCGAGMFGGTYYGFIRGGGGRRPSLLTYMSVSAVGAVAGGALGCVAPQAVIVCGVAYTGYKIGGEVIERLA